MLSYKPRIADKLLEFRLRATGAVLIEGAKWCGKTTTAARCAKSCLYMADADNLEQNLAAAELKPSLLLAGDVPRLLDEWQIAPKLWDAVRFTVDQRGAAGQFILTGSAVPADKSKFLHSGTGRFSWLRMRPMSLFESGESSGEVSLARLFSGSSDILGINPLSIQDLAFLTCRGGWPQAASLGKEEALFVANNYAEGVIHSDMSRVDGIKRDPSRIRKLLRVYARHQGTQASAGMLIKDMSKEDNPLSENTVLSYLSALRSIFVIEEANAWNPNVRSATTVRTSPTRYFVDPSIAAAALGLSPDMLMADLRTFGFLFETLCIRDLRVYAESIGGEVSHFRTKGNLECDAVVHLRNGKYGLVEIKLGGETAINHGVETLKEVESQLDTKTMGEPSFLMVLSGADRYAYRRTDGVLVVPVGTLRD